MKHSISTRQSYSSLPSLSWSEFLIEKLEALLSQTALTLYRLLKSAFIEGETSPGI